jgi:hypothetical protein
VVVIFPHVQRSVKGQVDWMPALQWLWRRPGLGCAGLHAGADGLAAGVVLRHASRQSGLRELGGESVQQLAEEQYDRGWHRRRKQPREVQIVGDPVRGRILLVEVVQTNGRTGKGRGEPALMSFDSQVR